MSIFSVNLHLEVEAESEDGISDEVRRSLKYLAEADEVYVEVFEYGADDEIREIVI